MKFNIATAIKRVGKVRRSHVLLPLITPTKSQAQDLATLIVQVPRFWNEWVSAHVMPAYDKALATINTRDHSSNGTAKSYVTDDDASDVQDEIDDGEQQAYRLILGITPQTTSWVVNVQDWHRKKFASGLLSTTGVDMNTLLNDEGDTVAAFSADIASLIRNVDDQTRNRIAGVVFRGLQNRTPRTQVAADIVDQTDLERARSLRIASDQTTKLSARLDQARQEQLGIDEYVWRHSAKRFPRYAHVIRDEKLYKWGDPPSDGPPGTLINCGCKAQAYIDLSDDEKEEAQSESDDDSEDDTGD